MTFTSIEFVLFGLVFFVLYWFVFNKRLSAQNILLLIANFVFYSWWSWRFALLLAVNCLINFYTGRYIQNTEAANRRTWLLRLGLLLNLGSLFFFKYFNFFIESLQDVFKLLHLPFSPNTLNIILPLGISFYTFRAISYLVDIKNKKVQATKDPVIFFNYICFFPTLLAGPIDRARTFLPQLQQSRQFTLQMGAEGVRQILWGVFKKVVIADSCATITSEIFNPAQNAAGSLVFIGAAIYLIQVYADFSGYSDMAIGIAKLMGFSISKNFNYPFFAKNIVEFWKRWHISLTSWLTEYVYTPLSFEFRKAGNRGIMVAIMLNFILVGLWHGANWTFIVFGILHGVCFIPSVLKGPGKKKKSEITNAPFTAIKEYAGMVGTFIFVMLTCILFRAENLANAVGFYKQMLSKSLLTLPKFTSMRNAAIVILLIIIFMVIEWRGRQQEFALSNLNTRLSKVSRWALYYTILLVVLWFSGKEQQFIYFRF